MKRLSLSGREEGCGWGEVVVGNPRVPPSRAYLAGLGAGEWVLSQLIQVRGSKPGVWKCVQGERTACPQAKGKLGRGVRRHFLEQGSKRVGHSCPSTARNPPTQTLLLAEPRIR